MKEIFIERRENILRIAVKVNNELVESIVEEQNDEPIIGEIYKARVKNILPAINSIFIDMGLSKEGYMYYGNDLKDANIKKALIERFLLFRALLTGQRRLVINVSQHTAAVEGQGQGLLSHFLVARLLTEDIEPGIGAERIRHHWRPQSISYLLLRHTDTNFCYIVWCQIVTLVDVRTVNHSFQSGTACGQHKKNRCGSSQRFTAHSDLIPFWARAVRGSSVICR